jgi:hypothetical protein
MPTNTYTPIASVTLSATASEVVFSGLPQTFRDLILVTDSIHSTTGVAVNCRFNGDAGSNYSFVFMRGNGSAATSSSGTTTAMNATDTFTTRGYTGTLQIFDYSQTNKHKTALLRKGGAFEDVQAWAQRWANTSAINSISLTTGSGTFASGSSFTLFGVIA